MRWLTYISLALAAPLCWLWADSIYHYNDIGLRLGRRQIAVSSAFFEMTVTWYADASKLNPSGALVQHSRNSTESLHGWFWMKRFQCFAGPNPWLGWSCGVAFPIWFLILLLPAPLTSRWLWQRYRRGRQQRGFQVQMV